MHYVVAITLLFQLISPCFGDETTSSVLQPAEPVTGTLKEADSTELKFTARYWGMTNRWENYETIGEGYHPWLEIERRVPDAKSFDDILALYTESSRAQVLDVREMFERSLARSATRPVNRKERPLRRIYYVTVNTMHNGLESVVVALGTRFERPEHFAPSFLVEAYTKTPEGWRRDATWKTSVIHREIGTGKWKQFGAPRDFSAPTSAAEFKALEEKSKKESGK